jgi:hypothetical protein
LANLVTIGCRQHLRSRTLPVACVSFRPTACRCSVSYFLDSKGPIADELFFFSCTPLRDQADVQEGVEGQIDGAVRWASLPVLPAQLLHLPLVWAPMGLRRQAPGGHRQRHRGRVPARLHFALHLLRRQQEDTGN